MAQTFHDRILNEGRYDDGNSMVAREVVFRLNQNEPLVGLEAFQNHMRVFQEAIPNLTYRTNHIYQDGDVVTLHWSCQGTQEKDLGELKATGKSIQLSGLSLFYFENEKITKNVVYFDTAEIPKQLGELANQKVRTSQ